MTKKFEAQHSGGGLVSYERAVDAVSLEDISTVLKLHKIEDTPPESLTYLVDAGSIHLNENTDPETYQSIMRARSEFFGEVLGWDDENHPLHQAYKKHSEFKNAVVPVDTFVGSQVVFSDCSLDATKIISACPQAIGLAPESVRAKVDNLSSLGLDATKIINALPQAIGLAPESVRAKVDNLSSLGLDAAKIINAFPAAIGLAPESVRAKVDNLSSLGLDATKIINALPQAIGLAPESVRAKFESLAVAGKIQPGDLAAEFASWTPSQISDLLVAPIEGIHLFLSERQVDKSELPRIGYRARRYMKKDIGATNAGERKHVYLERLPGIYTALGDVAIQHALRMTVPNGGFDLRNRTVEVADGGKPSAAIDI